MIVLPVPRLKMEKGNRPQGFHRQTPNLKRMLIGCKGVLRLVCVVNLVIL